MPSHLLMGLMSGTSMDAVDVAIVRFDDSADSPLNDTPVELLATREHELPTALHDTLLELCRPGDNEIEKLGVADREVGVLFAEAALQLLRDSGIAAEDIYAIGSHGQTIRHRPPNADTTEARAFTLQIGDPNLIAAQTGITTVADFRRRDMALGGQGAPLAPAFHRAVFAAPGQARAVINVGGIANISALNADGSILGFDCGPASVMMDFWTREHLGQAYDSNGNWAAGGSVDTALLKRMLNEPYLKLVAPKSTGRELFNRSWLDSHLAALLHSVSAQDVQATLLEYTAQCIRLGLEQIGNECCDIYLCGGGAHNGALLARLRDIHRPATVDTTHALGIGPDWVEAAAFAWLARQTLAGLPGNAATVTGARADTILGAIYVA